VSSGAGAYLVMREQLKWYEKDYSSPWIDALAELRQRASRWPLLPARPGDHVAIDQYAEKALGNRDYFLKQALFGCVDRRRRRQDQRRLRGPP
jgi:hypothetical protein